jgi:predicted secreted protein
MRATGRKIAAWGILLAVLLPLALAGQTEAGEQARDGQVKAVPQKPKVRTEALQPRPQNIKEKSAIIVFLVWMWLGIAVLLYVLRLKVREVDRVAGYETPSPSLPPKGGPTD